jgi:alkylation response protein AidB-like acyl-CoA dehydrogenase
MLISSVYVGAASALVERALARGRGSVTDRAAASIALESAVSLLEGVARSVRDGLSGDEAVAAVLLARFAVQQALRSATDKAAELLGGIAFMQSPEVAYQLAACRPLMFHPPSRGSAAEALVNYACGEPLRLA